MQISRVTFDGLRLERDAGSRADNWKINQPLLATAQRDEIEDDCGSSNACEYMVWFEPVSHLSNLKCVRFQVDRH